MNKKEAVKLKPEEFDEYNDLYEKMELAESPYEVRMWSKQIQALINKAQRRQQYNKSNVEDQSKD
jgi:hypothetical protein